MSDSVRPHRRQPTRLSRPWESPGKNTGVGCHFLLQCMKVKSESEVSQSYLTLSDPMDCSLRGSSVHGTFQARILEWVAIFFSRVSSQSRNRTWVSWIAGGFFTVWATRSLEWRWDMGLNQSVVLQKNGSPWSRYKEKLVFLIFLSEYHTIHPGFPDSASG